MANVFSGLHFATVGLPRSVKAKELVEDNGGRILSTVSKKADYVITVPDIAKPPKKLAKGIQMGLRTIDASWLARCVQAGRFEDPTPDEELNEHYHHLTKEHVSSPSAAHSACEDDDDSDESFNPGGRRIANTVRAAANFTEMPGKKRVTRKRARPQPTNPSQPPWATMEERQPLSSIGNKQDGLPDSEEQLPQKGKAVACTFSPPPKKQKGRRHAMSPPPNSRPPYNTCPTPVTDTDDEPTTSITRHGYTATKQNSVAGERSERTPDVSKPRSLQERRMQEKLKQQSMKAKEKENDKENCFVFEPTSHLKKKTQDLAAPQQEKSPSSAPPCSTVVKSPPRNNQSLLHSRREERRRDLSAAPERVGSLSNGALNTSFASSKSSNSNVGKSTSSSVRPGRPLTTNTTFRERAKQREREPDDGFSDRRPEPTSNNRRQSFSFTPSTRPKLPTRSTPTPTSTSTSTSTKKRVDRKDISPAPPAKRQNVNKPPLSSGTKQKSSHPPLSRAPPVKPAARGTVPTRGLGSSAPGARTKPTKPTPTTTAPKRKPPVPTAGKKKQGTEDEVESTPLSKVLASPFAVGIDEKFIKEIMTTAYLGNSTTVKWDDIAGLQAAKKNLYEALVLPTKRPDLFQGLRQPTKGVLLFGPPGTGKTMIAKAVASQCGATFFSLSASALMSKWLGESEKMVKALFAAARALQPSVLFMDEVDSMLSQRGDSEHEASRRLKTEYLAQSDGLHAIQPGETVPRVLTLGATNRPHDLDDAVIRRFTKRIYIPLPEAEIRKQMALKLLNDQHERYDFSDEDWKYFMEKTENYSGSDITNLVIDMAMGPIRELPLEEVETVDRSKIRAITIKDMKNSLQEVRASVAPQSLVTFQKWNQHFGMNANRSDGEE
eukprot:TRINITY_DN56812_c0_g1_i1.p1 TRINITY_DN56812_c0_g1~~TRINITY_DN56812_c0_g1_i1.p1  ORF type:complete len:889 (-),score=111.99 TRINITY_DN56812_c0_g1_i1:29-2695(-)